MRNLTRITAVALAGLCFAAPAAAADVNAAGAWVRGTVPGQTATGAYFDLSSRVDATLVGASSPVAGVVEIHEMRMDGQVMKMRPVPRLDLPAGKTVHLDDRGGYHVMLMDLKRPLGKGDVVPLTLKLEIGKKSESLTVQAPVRPLGEADDAEAAAPAHHHHSD